MTVEQAAGWGKSPASRKWHYFPTGESFSLCRKIGSFFGDRERGQNAHPDNCAECKKKLGQQKGYYQVTTWYQGRTEEDTGQKRLDEGSRYTYKIAADLFAEWKRQHDIRKAVLSLDGVAIEQWERQAKEWPQTIHLPLQETQEEV